MNKIIIIEIILILSFNLYAQFESDHLVTDRPDQTESSSVVPKGSLQIETGLVFENDNFKIGNKTEIKTNSLNLATTLVRYGIYKYFELRLGGQYTIEKTEIIKNTTELSGINGLDLGTKIFLREENGYFFEKNGDTEFTKISQNSLISSIQKFE
jgi:hypothetical protein